MAEGKGQSVPSWTVVRVEDTTAAIGAAGFGKVRRVYFRLLDGSQFFHDFPLEGFDPDQVKAAIDDQAATLYQVMDLQGAPVKL